MTLPKKSQSPTLQWRKGEFEKWKYDWLVAVCDAKVSKNAIKVAIGLCDYINRDTGAAFPSYNAIATKVRIRRNKVVAAMKELHDLRYVLREPRARKRGGHRYDEKGEWLYYPRIPDSPAIGLSKPSQIVPKLHLDSPNSAGIPQSGRGVTRLTSEEPLNLRGKKGRFGLSMKQGKEDSTPLSGVKPSRASKPNAGFPRGTAMPGGSVYISDNSPEMRVLERLEITRGGRQLFPRNRSFGCQVPRPFGEMLKMRAKLGEPVFEGPGCRVWISEEPSKLQ